MALGSSFLNQSNVGQKSFHCSSNCKIQRWMYCQRTLCQSRDHFYRPHNQWNLKLEHKCKFHFVSIRSLLKLLGSLCIQISQRHSGSLNHGTIKSYRLCRLFDHQKMTVYCDSVLFLPHAMFLTTLYSLSFQCSKSSSLYCLVPWYIYQFLHGMVPTFLDQWSSNMWGRWWHCIVRRSYYHHHSISIWISDLDGCKSHRMCHSLQIHSTWMLVSNVHYSFTHKAKALCNPYQRSKPNSGERNRC